MSNNPNETKEVFSTWLDIGFKLALALGALISWIFFSFFVNTLPSLGSIGDITIYLVSISAWSLILAFYIVAISFASSFLIKTSSNYINYYNNAFIYYYFGFPIISILFLLILKYFNLTQETINIILSFLFFVFPVIYSLFVKEFLPIRNINRVTRFLNRIIDIGLPLILFSLILLLIALMLDKFFNKLYVQSLIYSSFIVIIVFINYFIIKGDLQNWKKALGIAISYLAIISIIFSALKIDNPMIVKPFELLKLGYYKAELHFKEDFVNKANPFPLNENNQTSNVFFILSSIGDEYILRETRTAEDHNDSNVSNHNNLYPFDYNGTRYYCEDDNQSLIWSASRSNKNYIHKIKNRTRDFNETIKKQLEYWKTIDQKTYRIKKENVEFEVVGKEIETQSTVWEHNAKK